MEAQAKDDVSRKVKEVIVEQLEVKEEEVTPEKKFVDDLGADSLDLVQISLALEEYYEIEISDEDAEKLVTVQTVIDYIEGRLKKKGENERLYPTYSI